MPPLCGCLEIGPPDCTKTAFHTMSPYCETSILATKHNERRQLSQFNARFRDRRAPRPWAQKGGHQFGSWASNLSIASTCLGPNLALFGGRKTQTGAAQYLATRICCARASELAAAHFRNTMYTYIHTQFYIPIYTAHIT